MAQQAQLALGDLAGDPYAVFLVEVRGRADHRLGQHPVLGQDQKPPRIHVQPAQRRQARVAVRDHRAFADQGRAGQKAHGGNLAGFRLGRDHAHRLVHHHGQVGAQLRFSVVREHQGLAGGDLVARIDHGLAVDGHQPPGDQGLGLAARTDPALGQPAIDPLGFGFVIAAGPGHGP